MADKPEHKEKRKPGRPPKVKAKEPTGRIGIAEEPSNPRHVVEFLYDKPSNFKKICSYWSSLNADKIKFIFTKESLILYTKDYKETNDVGITCDGNKINRYYCAAPITIGVSFSNLELVLSKLDKSYECISFVLKDATQNKTLHCTLQNDVNMYEYFDIDIVIDATDQTNQYHQMFQDQTPYTLEFKLPGKYFKKAISDAKQFEKQWTIEKFGENGNMMFSYKSSNGQVKARIIPKDLKDIDLKSRVVNKEIFSVSVYIDTLRPTSSSQLADVIHIKAERDKPLWIWADLDDKAIMINALIKIVDHRVAT